MSLHRQALAAELRGQRLAVPDVGEVDDHLPGILAVTVGFLASLVLGLVHLLRTGGLVVGERLRGVFPFLGYRVPAHQANRPDELLVVHDVLDHPLGLLRRLFVPRVDEDVGAIAGDDDAAPEQLAGLVVELQVV